MSSRYSDLSLDKRIASEARPYWAHLAGICLLSLLSAPLTLLSPLPLKIAVDSVLGDSPLPQWLGMMLPATTENNTTGSTHRGDIARGGDRIAPAVAGVCQLVAPIIRWRETCLGFSQSSVRVLATALVVLSRHQRDGRLIVSNPVRCPVCPIRDHTGVCAIRHSMGHSWCARLGHRAV